MPLIHRKTPSAFKKNIEIEMEHGKPQKQALAIAYSVKRDAEHHKMAQGGCIGPSCRGCSSANCYAKGGEVESDEWEPRETKSAMHPEKHHKGVHESSRFGTKGVSMAGEDQRTGLDSKEEHHRVLGEMRAMKKPKLYAEGGSVSSWTKREDNERGVHGEGSSNKNFSGESMAGKHVRHAQEHPEDKEDSMGAAKLHHKKVLGEMKAMPKPKLYAEGGEVSDGEPQMEDELKHAMGGELMDALERKDRKGIMSAMEAIVLSCRGKD
jgi:hypothetical protein